jgi:hypothetical protein
VLKATIAVTLAAAVALSACTGKKEEAAAPAAAPAAPAAGAMPADHPVAKPSAAVDYAGIAKAEGGKTVAEVYAEKDALAGQPVSVRGKVVKTNTGIMNMDWVHVRDGSGEEGSNDLTVTTKGGAVPQVGDTVLVTGTVVLNKDFGMGYSYPVMLENAEVKVEGAPATP